MTEEKRNRIIAAITVSVVLLIAILTVVCIYQIVEMTTLNKRKKEMEQKIEYYQTETEKNEHTLEYYKSEEGLWDMYYKIYG